MSKVSVIMAVYNETEERLRRAADSILNQTYEDFLFIIIDDGSTETETIKSLKLLQKKDSRIRVVRQENAGPMAAANRGLAETSSGIVFRHDSDDWSAPQRFESQLSFMNSNPEVVALGSACRLYQEDGFPIADCQFPISPEEVNAAISVVNPFAHGATCFRYSAAQAIGFYEPGFRSLGDYDFFWRLIDAAKLSGISGAGGANLPDVLYHRVYRTGSVTETRVRERRRNRKIIDMRAEARTQSRNLSYDEAWSLVQERGFDRAEALIAHADDLMRAGKFAAAGTAYLKGWTIRPWRMKSLLKLCRLGLYATLPRYRWRMFKERQRVMRPPGYD